MIIAPATRIQRTTLIAILSAISFGLMLFPQVPIIPGADFLKLDFSIIPVVIGLYWLNYTSAVWIILLRTLLKLILANEGVNTYLGLPVNLIVILTFITVMKITMPNVIYLSRWSKKIIPLISSTIAITVVAVLVNWFVAVPMYAKFANFDIAKFIGLKNYFIGMVVPFNLIEGSVWFAVSIVVLMALAPLQRRFRS
ncbi:ECF transporter S component [Leuconostoc litchii]|uniref:Riboflavin transporter n=1 Tax=Leuconostoc litchii TaxID=1981069 RepID=A0A6P2CLD0_9LACO|nr:ECF transporter S component [Leuconostoc litchii]TYC46790.1 ECF transporter S component [Leuconostoc litchii]